MNLSWRKINLLVAKTFIRYFKLILTVVILGVLAAGYYWFWQPEFKKVSEKTDLVKFKDYEQYLDDYLIKLQELQVARRQLAEEIQEKLDKILPKEDDLAGLFVQLEALAKENGFVLNSLDISQVKEETKSQVGLNLTPPTSQGSKIKKINIAASFSGNNYPALKNLLAAIEFNLRLFDINEITFEQPEKGPYTINLRTYYLER